MNPRSSAPDITAFKLMCVGCFSEALPLAKQAVAGARECLPAHGMLATILLRLGRAQEAELVVLQALACAQGVVDAYDGLAHVSMLLGQHQRSNALYRRVVEMSPKTPRFLYNLASSERSLGQLDEAEAACNRAIELDSTQYPSYLLRSELRVQTPNSNHVEELQSILRRQGMDDRVRLFLGYALGKELDDLQRFEEAFRWFSEAALARKRHLSYDVAVDERKLQRIAEAFPAVPNRVSTTDDHGSQHIFVVGLPRSGTTLLERILTGLPNVRSNGETDNFSNALMASAPLDGRDLFLRAAAADPGVVASQYSRLAGTSTRDGKVVEKLPMNYLYLGAIHRALPGSPILLMHRSAMDSCFAMYRTLFAAAYPFSYDLNDLARYYASYEKLICHWNASFREQIQEVVYEDLVKNPIRIGTKVAQRCGLAWADSAIEVHKNSSASLTASAAQVRRPIYGSSSGRWRHYRKHLEPLIEALQNFGVSVEED